MISWGISANSHDAALSVFVDDELVFASHSERFSGIKNDKHLCQSLVDYARQWGEPDQIYWYENPYLKTARQLLAGQGWNWKKNNIKKYLKQWNINSPIKYTSHHLSHAAAGYYTSNFNDACIVVIDSIGEFDTLTVWDVNNSKFNKLHSTKYPTSVGLWYSAMTQRLGLKPNEDEYILMGMAAYGDKHIYSDKIKNDFIANIVDIEFNRSFHRGCMNWEPMLPVSQYFDVAAGVQDVYEDILKNILIKASTLSPSENLILMGGCALNCLANRHIGEYFNHIWIMPNPGDAGSAIGAVLAHTKKKIEWTNSYLGYDMGYSTDNQSIVDYLLEHKICGLARGKAEFGPRALGNRSLLADPRGIEIKDKVNAIKQRQEFRPFAPAILEEYVDQYFDMPSQWDNSRYMQAIATCRLPELFPAIVHRDGTSRVQTVPDDGSDFRKLLELWYNTTGCPMLLNTSLNIKGQPMVNNHNNAKQFELQYNVKVFN
jgi:carbamoyltransferase